ncbi:Atlastin-1 [Halotydeus destructor]|nr:Atlastin-1 [Halotydeus destructor]
MDGKPETILNVTRNGNTDEYKFEPNLDMLYKILHHDDCWQMPVCLISIIGSARKGKSVMMNWMLQYLSSSKGDNWMTEKKKLKHEFPWNGGDDSVTMGIVMWSKPFVVEQDGRQVAVLLMDTQGLFDGQISNQLTEDLFGISTLASSVQIFNLMSDIQEDTLQYLEKFTTYGRKHFAANGGKAFQKLLFLIRDFGHRNIGFGHEAGSRFLDKKLSMDRGGQDVRHVRRHLRDAFEDLECFTLPHPGRDLAECENVLCPLESIDKDFLDNVKAFIRHTLQPGNLTLKTVGGRHITGLELYQYFRQYVDVIIEKSLSVETISEANQLGFFSSMAARAFTQWQSDMSRALSSPLGVTDENFQAIVTHATESAVRKYNDSIDLSNYRHPGYGNSLNALQHFMDDQANVYRIQNDFRKANFVRGLKALGLLVAAGCVVAAAVLIPVGLPAAMLAEMGGVAGLAKLLLQRGPGVMESIMALLATLLRRSANF